jgi:dihydrofolate reductase
VISGNVYEQIAELKEQPGKNIAISVSATLVWSLLRAGMLDQLKLLMHPLVVGSASKRLFSESDQRAPLTFVDATTFKTDVLKLTYVPAAS